MDERCSYCHDGTERENPAGQRELGCPQRRCPECGQTYFDAAYEEDALYTYHQKPVMPRLIQPLVRAALIIVLNIMLIAKMFQGFTVPLVIVLSWGLGTTAALVRSWVQLHPWLFHKRYLRKHEENKRAILDGWIYKSDEISRSIQRMSSEEYLYYLISHGVDVPDFFFERIHCTPDAARVQELQEAFRARREVRSRAEKLRQLRTELEYYRECLSMDPDSSEFKMLATADGRTAPGFRAYCQSRAAQLQQKIDVLENN